MNELNFATGYYDTIWRDVVTIPKLPVQEIWEYIINWLEELNVDYKDVHKFNHVFAEHGSRGGKTALDAKKEIHIGLRPNDDESITVVVELEFSRVSKFGISLLGDTFDAFDDIDSAKRYRSQWQKFCDPFLSKVTTIVNVIEKQETAGKPMHCPWCGHKVGYPWPRFCLECGGKLDRFNVAMRD
ncbi:MAG: hypothetical protein GF364_08495 [Candidatus Lokiarchaeota archaeon]|nr:hypothetical protein [Candidatus Lokiarchaeota archaeon]